MHKSQTAAMSLIITDYDNQYEKSTDIDTADNNSCYSKCNTDGVVFSASIIGACILSVIVLGVMSLLFFGGFFIKN